MTKSCTSVNFAAKWNLPAWSAASNKSLHPHPGIGYFPSMTTIPKQQKIVLGVSGGIACYKAVELVRLLVKANCSVQVIMTRSAMEFVTPLTFQTLSGHPVATETFSLTQESGDRPYRFG